MQCGATAKRGTYFASHLVLMLINMAKLQDACVFVLFLDLVKAFDRVVRELVCGMTDEQLADPLTYFVSLGVSAETARKIILYLGMYGSACQQWQVYPKTAELIARLHRMAWFSVC
eukprot:9260789-Pyramimonas_sp.AAC.1